VDAGATHGAGGVVGIMWGATIVVGAVRGAVEDGDAGVVRSRAI
jgi:hypothetical protein